MTTATTYIDSNGTEKAVSKEVAFAAVKSGDWDFATFEDWVSEKEFAAYSNGDSDRSYYDSMSSAMS